MIFTLNFLDSGYFSAFHSLQSTTSPLKSPTEAMEMAMKLVTKDDPPDAQVCTQA